MALVGIDAALINGTARAPSLVERSSEVEVRLDPGKIRGHFHVHPRKPSPRTFVSVRDESDEGVVVVLAVGRELQKRSSAE